MFDRINLEIYGVRDTTLELHWAAHASKDDQSTIASGFWLLDLVDSRDISYHTLA